jgi:tripartite-type tricarboxylate transporter receptor subunit TctC
MNAALATKIAGDVSEVLKDPALAERLTVLGIDPVGEGPREYSAALATDRARMEKAVKVAGAKAE